MNFVIRVLKKFDKPVKFGFIAKTKKFPCFGSHDKFTVSIGSDKLDNLLNIVIFEFEFIPRIVEDLLAPWRKVSTKAVARIEALVIEFVSSIP